MWSFNIFSSERLKIYLFIIYNLIFSPDLEQLLTKVQQDAPMLAALHMDTDNPRRPEQLLARVSGLKKLVVWIFWYFMFKRFSRRDLEKWKKHENKL